MSTSTIRQTMNLARVTPDIATEWLTRAAETSANFRPLDHRRSGILANQIRETGWKVDANPFKFNSRGVLVDGQHRAAAIASLGITVEAWIAHGVDDDITIDTGRSRTMAQILQSRGEKYATTLAPTLALLQAHGHGNLEGALSGGQGYSNGQLLRTLEANPGIRDSIARVVHEGQPAPRAALALVHYVATRAGAGAAADGFVDRLTSGTDLGKDDPIRLLRERMITNGRATKARLLPREKAALVITAWNYWVAGRAIASLRWRGVGPAAQPFPAINVSAAP